MLNKKALAATAGAGDKLYVEDVFSTYLFTGTGSSQTITNNIDLSTEGGLVWTKRRNASSSHGLYDTLRGTTKRLRTNTTDAEDTLANSVTAFNTDGFSIGSQFGNTETYASWTFRQAEKFFDVVTYTGNGALPNQLISHNLGSVPGCIIIKSTDAARDWIVWHRGNGTNNHAGLSLNSTNGDGGAVSGSDLPTSTQFKPAVFYDINYNNANETGVTYVAYLFAHNAGGFGDSGTDNVVSCGSFTRTFGTANSVNLGYEPQWVLIKCTSQTDSWQLYDTMRGLNQTQSLKLEPNSANPDSDTAGMIPTATGFDITATGVGGGTFIYIAIRRGPMKTPEAGTEVYNATKTSSASGTVITTGIAADLSIVKYLDGNDIPRWNDRLRGFANIVGNSAPLLASSNTNAELPGATGAIASVWNTGFTITGTLGGSNTNYYSFRRAPGFMDIVCYTGTGSARTVTHNLGAAPELMIVKRRDSAENWAVYASGLTDPASWRWLKLNLTDAQSASSAPWDDTAPTSTVFSLSGVQTTVNASGGTYVAYLFATLAGVSKVGSYTGTGTTLQVNCGFTGGARFVLIKRTDSTGDWYVWDTARGIGSGNDPYLRLNSNLAEVTTTDYIDTYSSGFQINSTAPADINANGGTFIFLAIA